jgi:hypothetical protein
MYALVTETLQPIRTKSSYLECLNHHRHRGVDPPYTVALPPPWYDWVSDNDARHIYEYAPANHSANVSITTTLHQGELVPLVTWNYKYRKDSKTLAKVHQTKRVGGQGGSGPYELQD